MGLVFVADTVPVSRLSILKRFVLGDDGLPTLHKVGTKCITVLGFLAVWQPV